MKKTIAFLAILIPLLLIGCSRSVTTPDANPKWVQKLIAT
jgi:hypothetical protein